MPAADDHVGMSRPALALGTLVALVAALAAAACIGGKSLVSCGEESERILSAIPHYGGERPEPSLNVSGDCSVAFTTSASTSKVLGHYAEALKARGWTVDHEARTNFVIARRDGWQLDVADEGDRPGGRREIVVSVIAP